MTAQTSNELGKFHDVQRFILNITGLLILIGILIALGVFIVEIRAGNQTDDTKSVNHANETLPSTIHKFNMVTRDEWGARPPVNRPTYLKLPVDRVIIANTGTGGCTNETQCALRVRQIQTYHMDWKNWDDIAYNFLVGGDGAVYEGRGWDKLGAHTKAYNTGSIGVALIGTFNNISPPNHQFETLRLLLEEGVQIGKLTIEYKMYPHRVFFTSDSPGDKVIDIIEHWPHYVPSYNQVKDQ